MPKSVVTLTFILKSCQVTMASACGKRRICLAWCGLVCRGHAAFYTPLKGAAELLGFETQLVSVLAYSKEEED